MWIAILDLSLLTQSHQQLAQRVLVQWTIKIPQKQWLIRILTILTKFFCAEAPCFSCGEEAQFESCVKDQLVVEYRYKNSRSMSFQ